MAASSRSWGRTVSFFIRRSILGVATMIVSFRQGCVKRPALLR
jgi:hypothetical protein